MVGFRHSLNSLTCSSSPKRRVRPSARCEKPERALRDCVPLCWRGGRCFRPISPFFKVWVVIDNCLPSRCLGWNSQNHAHKLCFPVLWELNCKIAEQHCVVHKPGEIIFFPRDKALCEGYLLNVHAFRMTKVDAEVRSEFEFSELVVFMKIQNYDLKSEEEENVHAQRTQNATEPFTTIYIFFVGKGEKKKSPV